MYKQICELLRNSRRTVFFGGAGLSTESGIPDFRSSDGIYSENFELAIRWELIRIGHDPRGENIGCNLGIIKPFFIPGYLIERNVAFDEGKRAFTVGS